MKFNIFFSGKIEKSHKLIRAVIQQKQTQKLRAAREAHFQLRFWILPNQYLDGGEKIYFNLCPLVHSLNQSLVSLTFTQADRVFLQASVTWSYLKSKGHAMGSGREVKRGRRWKKCRTVIHTILPGSSTYCELTVCAFLQNFTVCTFAYDFLNRIFE